MAMYESDVTKFVRDLLEQQPELKELQRKNRATWWDKILDRDQLKRNEQSEAPKAPYAYFPLPKADDTVPAVPPAPTDKSG
jgi:hypothetical protein